MSFLLRSFAFLVGVVLSLAGLTGKARAQAVITWSGYYGTGISGESDVLTAGSLVAAYRLVPTGVTGSVSVNGVPFQALPFPDREAEATTAGTGNVSFVETDEETFLTGVSGLGSSCGDFSSLPSSYQTLLSYGGATFGEYYTYVHLTLSGLTAGHDYTFQWWMNDSSGASAYMAYANDTFGNIIDLSTSEGSGALGQFGVGTFTAVGSSEEIVFSGDYGRMPLINAFQLRDVSAIPEPSTYAALAALAMLGFAVRRRSRA